MSILNSIPNELTPSQIIAKNIINQTRRTYNQMVMAFNDGAKLFWQNQNNLSPTEIASALGTDAKEVFQLHYALGQLVGSIKPEAIAEGLSVIGQFTMNDDGTVTIIEPPAPE